MKILMINKFFYIKGGSETYYFELKRLLEAKGHKVIDFSMEDERNFDSPYAEYFVDNVDYGKKMGPVGKLRAACNIIYSMEAKKKLEQLIRETRPDIAHLHIFQHQLSPSILDVLGKYRIPVVYTAHDLKMLCLNYVMLSHGAICEKCRGGRYLNCLRQRCVKDSFVKSAVNVAEGYIHRWRRTYDKIDIILTPSDFYRNKFIEFGIRPERVRLLPNFLGRDTPRVDAAPDKEKYFLYFGRLSREKGIMTLIRAVKGLDCQLTIVGTGPNGEEIEQYIRADGIDHVKLLGYRSGQELINLVGNARAVILPSEWYENGPYSAIEALQLGRPVIGSDLGGIPELIQGNGAVFRHGDVKGLRECIRSFPQPGSEKYLGYCHRSREIFESRYQAGPHYDALIQIYENLLREKSQ